MVSVQKARSTGYCVGCHRDGLEVEPRRSHGERVLCDRCADRPFTMPSGDGFEEPLAASRNGSRPDPASASTWKAVDLAPIVAGLQAGEIVGPVPSLMPRSDGLALVYPGEVHSLAGEPEGGKGWIALAETARLLTAGQHVLYIDFEDAPASVIGRLLSLGVAADATSRLRYVRPEEAPALDSISSLLTESCALAVIDGLSEAYSLLGLDYGSNIDVPAFLRRLARPLAATGAAVLQIDHVPKDKGNRGRYAIGGQHKLAGVAVAYGVEVIERPTRSTPGRVKLILAKDRHGHVPGGHGETVALVTITPIAGSVHVTLDPPDDRDEHGRFRPTGYMERVSKYVEANPGATLTAIRGALKGANTYKDAALDVLVTEGWIERQQDGQAKRHRSVRPFREDDDQNTTPPNLPNPAETLPRQGSRNPADLPPPYGAAGSGGKATEADPACLGPFDPWAEGEPA